MTIRKATGEDLEEVLRYAMQMAEQHGAYNKQRFTLFPDHQKQLREFFAVELNSPASVILLLIINDQPAGFSFVKMAEDDLESMHSAKAWLCDIYVDGQARGTGGGKFLMEASKKAAAELGAAALMLHVATQNKHAKDFFSKYGFAETMAEMMYAL